MAWTLQLKKERRALEAASREKSMVVPCKMRVFILYRLDFSKRGWVVLLSIPKQLW